MKCTCGVPGKLHWSTCPIGQAQREMDPDIEQKHNRAGKYYDPPFTTDDKIDFIYRYVKDITCR